MNKNHRTTLQIRKADVDIYSDLAKYNFSAFVSYAMRKLGKRFIADKKQELKQGKKLPYVNWD